MRRRWLPRGLRTPPHGGEPAQHVTTLRALLTCLLRGEGGGWRVASLLKEGGRKDSKYWSLGITCVQAIRADRAFEVNFSTGENIRLPKQTFSR
jgi:hypothetical protein